jgi:hypothetical protein
MGQQCTSQQTKAATTLQPIIHLNITWVAQTPITDTTKALATTITILGTIRIPDLWAEQQAIQIIIVHMGMVEVLAMEEQAMGADIHLVDTVVEVCIWVDVGHHSDVLFILVEEV